MRLLNTTKITLEEFENDSIPEYAILSHRWELDEVSFQDMENGKAIIQKGYAKIKGCCVQAAKDGWKYAWIDTCCIDKSSSAELSQAINSMYQWYSNAQVCYAYLSDVSAPAEPQSNPEFYESKWFKRGWTLQELLAPSEVVFFNKFWSKLGTKASLEDPISDITGIEYLSRWGQASIAQKMSWASKRETTRVEDMAYCLLGLFDVHMPPLYGEGESAFLRLQIEIMRQNDDETIFAWEEDASESGLLAKSPVAFRHSGDVRQIGVGEVQRKPYNMTNKGLQIELILLPAELALNMIERGTRYTDTESSPRISKYGSFIAPLNCIRGAPLAIRLERSRGYQYYRVPSVFFRLDLHDFSDRVDVACEHMLKTGLAVRETIHVRQRVDNLPYFADGDPGNYEFIFEKPADIHHIDTLSRWDSGCSWRHGYLLREVLMEKVGEVLRIQVPPSLNGSWVACIFKHSSTSSIFCLMIYFDQQYAVGVHICDFTSLAEELSANSRNFEKELRLERVRSRGLYKAWDKNDRSLKLLQNRPYQMRPEAERAANTNMMLSEMQTRWQEQELNGNEWTQKLEAQMEEIYQEKLLKGTSRSYYEEADIGTEGHRGQIYITAELKTGSHLGKRRFEVYIHDRVRTS